MPFKKPIKLLTQPVFALVQLQQFVRVELGASTRLHGKRRRRRLNRHPAKRGHALRHGRQVIPLFRAALAVAVLGHGAHGVGNTVIKINSKTNQITLDSCKKVSVVCTDIVGGIEVVNANGVQVQVLGKAPTISVEKTSGAQVYVSKEGLDVEIITAKSDSVNVHVPKADGEFDEQPIPEQFKTLIVNGKLETNEVDHSD